MVNRNPHLAKLQSNYLFVEINKRKQKFLEKYPDAKLISLGIGDTTEPIPSTIVKQMSDKALELGTAEGYSGYGLEKGQRQLRSLIASNLYQNKIDEEEIFISDGAKCDIGRLQLLFGSQAKIAVQDPSYPVYIDTAVMMGQSNHFDSSLNRYANISYMECDPSNNFFPNLSKLSSVDLIYFCSPNNPTGAVATYSQLEELIDFAKTNRAIIIYDAAYASFIQDPSLPRSIYELPGASQVAIELGSFSKMVGFTGVRLGWSVVPKELRFENGSSILEDWNRINSTFFNGASSIAQAGGIAALSTQGQKEMNELILHYRSNALILKQLFRDLGLPVFGGVNAPYLWVKIAQLNSWEAFQMILEQAHVICTPGSGFGPNGEGFLRFSAFGKKENILEACERLQKVLNQNIFMENCART